MTTPPTHLDPSELGNKDYWDATYTHDLTTNAHNPSHTGTAWFTDSSAPLLTIQHLLSLSLPASTTFLDLGTGNGSLLFLLRASTHFTGRMLGIDYSPASILLARRIALQKGYSEEEVAFKEWDILTPPTREDGWNEDVEFDVVLDKGTFDAVSLNEETDEAGRRVCEGYCARVVRMVKVGGTFLVTSCNWTEGELREWFEYGAGGDDPGGRFAFDGKVEYPKFRFRGVEGQSVYGVCFRRVR